MQKFTAIKDPDAVHDYIIDWSDVMNLHSPVDSISSSSWVTDQGTVIDSDSNTSLQTTVWLSGGTLNEVAKLVNTIITTGGRTYVRTINVSILDT